MWVTFSAPAVALISHGELGASVLISHNGFGPVIAVSGPTVWEAIGFSQTLGLLAA